MLEIQSLAYRYSKEVAIHYKDWLVKENDHALILGNSGSGKTTLLHLIGALLKPSEGFIQINGQDTSQLSSSSLDRFRGKNIGIVFQQAHLIQSLSVKENLRLAQSLAFGKTDSHRINAIMNRLEIGALSQRKIHQISQGQAQRVSIARAVLNDPKLLLADEPTASLDDTNCQLVVNLLKEQATLSGTTLVIATHDQRIKSEFKNTLSL